MKLIVSATVETPHGDKMVPLTVDIGEATNNHIRHSAVYAITALLRKATDIGEHKLRAASIVVEP